MADEARIVCVNGEFISAQQATISIFDRGFLMADAVYEVSAVIDGKLIANREHLERLARSLQQLQIAMPKLDIEELQLQLIARNNLVEGIVYIQITRGTCERDFIFKRDMQPNVVMFTQRRSLLNNAEFTSGVKVMTMPDIRWGRRDIKSTQLIAQSLAKMHAKDNGYHDAWFVDEQGYITEGSANNVAIIRDGKFITRPANCEILNGITRQTLFAVLESCQLTLLESKFSVHDAQTAAAALMSASGALLVPVIAVDDVAVGGNDNDAANIAIVAALRRAYLRHVCPQLSL